MKETPIAYYGATTTGTQPRRNETTMGNVDISDLMMMIRSSNIYIYIYILSIT